MGKWNPDLLNSHLAPEIADFDRAEIPDLQAEFPDADAWVTNHFLHNVCTGGYARPYRRFATNLMYRSQALFRSYAEARSATLEYLANSEPHSPSSRRYFAALSRWETLLLNWRCAFDLFFYLERKKQIFEPGDGSPTERACAVFNVIKHHAGEVGDPVSTETEPIPFWLNNQGVRTRTVALTYAEVADLVREVARIADDMKHPTAFVAKLEAAREAATDDGGPA
jgi:hypothetical protein